MTREPTWGNELRVFVSSTFEDLAAARDVLARRVFPRVRAHCESQGVGFSDIDLRWGVTEETIDQGKLIEYCFTEIERSNCFVGLLGNRYGTVVDPIPRVALERFPWLAKHAGESITELEFHAGILSAEASTPHCAIYHLAPEPNEKTDRRQARLVEAVRAAGLPLQENLNHEQLEQRLFEELCRIADRHAASGAEKLQSPQARHDRFASRDLKLFQGRDETLARLDAYLQKGGSPLALTGMAGIGKTALLAAWRRHLAPLAGQDLFVFYFAEADGDRASLAGLLEHLVEAALSSGLIEVDIARKRREIPEAIPDWLYTLSERVRLLLVVDGIDLLDDRDGARELLWLPTRMPDSARVVVSFRPGRTTQAALERGYEVIQLEELAPPERVAYAREFLARYGKTLNDENAARIAQSPACGVPAFLAAVLAELRFYTSHRGVAGELDWYLKSGSVEALYGRLLSRLEQDRHLGPPGFLSQALGLILGARRGLLEAEILDLLGNAEGPLPASSWVPLRQRLAAIISTERGLLTPTGALAREMIDRHFDLASAQDAVCARLADYFALRLDSLRGREEAAWHLRRAGRWAQLSELWRHAEMLAAAAESDDLEQVRLDWVEIEKRTGESAAAAYAGIIDAPWQAADYAAPVAALLMSLGHDGAAHELLIWLSRAGRFGQNPKIEAEASVRLALVQVRQGKVYAAMMSSAQAVAAAQAAGDKRLVARTTAESAALFAGLGMADKASELYRHAAAIFRELGAHFDLASCLNDFGVLLEQGGDLSGALDTYTEAERAFATAGSFRWVTRSRSHQATVHWLMGNRMAAIDLWNKVAAAFRMLNDESGLATALANCGGSLAVGIDEAQVALPSLSEAETLFERRHDLHGLARVAYSRMIINARQGVIDVHEVDRLIDLRRRANSQAGLEEQLLALRNFLPGHGAVNAIDALQRAIARINAKPTDENTTLTPSPGDGAGPALGEDPFSGLTNEQLLDRLAKQSALAGEANNERRFEDALNHAGVCMAIIEAIETHRPGQIEEAFLRINAFSFHFNLVLILYKMQHVERGLLEAEGAARRYKEFLKVTAPANASARASTQPLAEALPSILEQFVELSPPGDKLKAYRARASALKLLAEAQPEVFLGRYGSALRGLSVSAHDASLRDEAMSAAMASIEALHKAVEMQGDAYVRELGFSMRYAIDSLGREDLREAYDKVVAQEAGIILRRVHPELATGTSDPAKKKRWWWPFS